MDETQHLKGLAEMISFSPEYLERRTMDMCVKRKKLDEQTLGDALDQFSKKIKEFKGFVVEKEDVESEAGGYQHLESGVGLGYIKLDVNEKLADDKMLQSCLLKDLISNVEYLYKELKCSFDDYIQGRFDHKRFDAESIG